MGSRRVYFDNGATTYPKPEPVYSAVDRFMRDVGGSAGRSGHSRAVETGRIVYETRSHIADLFNAGDPLRIAFTKNATEALNVAIWGVLRPGDHVVVSSVEHNSVMRPLEAAKSIGVTYSVAVCSGEGLLEPGAVEKLITEDTALVAINHVSNVAGSILPVWDICEVVQKRGIPLLVDAAQSAGRLALDLEGSGVDLLAFTGHKELFGPQGTGGLYIREGLEVEPRMQGGTGSRSSDLAQPFERPDRYECGTLNAPGLAGLGAGVRFVLEEGVDAIRVHEVALAGRFMEGLAGIDGVSVLGPKDTRRRVGILPLVFDRMTPAHASAVLERDYGIATRAGIHCSPLAHRTLGTLETGVTRVSLSYMNTEEQIDYLLECLSDMSRN